MRIRLMKRANDTDVFEKLAQRAEPSATETSDVASELEVGDATEAPENEPDGAAAQTFMPPRRRRLLRRVLAGMAAVVLVAALGTSAFLGWKLKERDDAAAAGRAALAAAQRYAVTLTSVDANNIDQNFTQVLDGATGEFKDMYSQSASQLRQVLIDNKAVSRGTVVDAAIKSATTTKVEVVLFIDQSISNVVNPDPRIDRSRVAMTMELIDNRWLASKVDIK
jgi:Mce-associated membrane protein